MTKTNPENDPTEIYIRLFLIVPLLFYTGFCIFQEKSHISSLLFHMIVILMILLILFFHLKFIFKVLRHIFKNELYQKEFGFFLLSLAVFMTFLCLRDLYKNQHPR